MQYFNIKNDGLVTLMDEPVARLFCEEWFDPSDNTRGDNKGITVRCGDSVSFSLEELKQIVKKLEETTEFDEIS